jgi:hypothetical protein
LMRKINNIFLWCIIFKLASNSGWSQDHNIHLSRNATVMTVKTTLLIQAYLGYCVTLSNYELYPRIHRWEIMSRRAVGPILYLKRAGKQRLWLAASGEAVVRIGMRAMCPVISGEKFAHRTPDIWHALLGHQTQRLGTRLSTSDLPNNLHKGSLYFSSTKTNSNFIHTIN